METVTRVVFIYVMILLGLRLLGKREFGQLSALELVTLLLVPEIVSPALTRDDNSVTNAIIAVATLFSLVFATSLFSHRFRRVEAFIAGQPTVLVARGRLLEEAMNRERISTEELFSELHKNGLERVRDVRWAILESDGRISVVPERA